MNRYISLLMTIVVPIMFTNCEFDTTDQFDEKSSKEILTSNVWYYADTPADKYIMSEFTAYRLSQNVYEDASFSNVIYSKKYTVQYNGDILYLQDEYGQHVCNFTTCQNHDWIAISCDGGTVYIEGWRTKSLALSHSAK